MKRPIHSTTLALAAACLALAPGRAAAAPPAIYVTNYNNDNGDVPAYTATGAPASGYTEPSGFGDSDTSDVEGVAVDPATNTLYVDDAYNNFVLTYNATTGAYLPSNFFYHLQPGLNHPYGLLLAGGNLLVANSGTNSILAFNPASAAPVTTGFTSPAGLNGPTALASVGTTLYISNASGNFVGAYNMATGAAVPGFNPVTNLDGPAGLAVFGNDLFVANINGGTVGEYNATTGAVINANFLSGLTAGGPYGLALLGNNLLVTFGYGTTVGEYGIPAMATAGNLPTSSNASFLTGLSGPSMITVVPEPSTWALLGLGALGLFAAALRRRVRAA